MKTVNIAVVRNNKYEYVNEAPFRPSFSYLEAIFPEISEKDNHVYDMVRECIHLMGYDEEKYGTSDWNPFGKFISPGQTVLIKPNLVMDKNRSGGGTDCLYTQPSVVAPVIDYVCIALKGIGKIIVGDAPMQECDFNALVEQSGYRKMIQFYKNKGVEIELVDFRELVSIVENGLHKATINGDVEGTVVNLGRDSEFYGESEEALRNMRVTNYDPRIMPRHHTGETHEYYISNYVLNADVVINMPKPKTHRKGGVTISLKNMVGINARKEFLPHHTIGDTSNHGDEYLRASKLHWIQCKMLDQKNICVADNRKHMAQLYRWGIAVCSRLMRFGNHPYFEGSWYGNHTISRTISDLNKILLYADRTGVMRDTAQRKILIIADMIVAGEKEGPVLPSPYNAGVIAAGENPIAFDMVISTLMGLDYKKIPAIVTAGSIKKLPLDSFEEDSINVVSNDSLFDKKKVSELRKKKVFSFLPTSGWREHIEL